MSETPLEQKRRFANTTDATSFILKHLGFRSRRLRDFICGLQGVAGARHEFDCTHLFLARRLDHNGKIEAAETFVSRYLDALEKEQHRTGRLLFHIERGGGKDRRPTHYTDYITAAAMWVVRQAEASELWAQSHTKAIEYFAAAAIEMLPLIEEEAAEVKDNHDPFVSSFDVQIARNRAHALSRARSNFALIKEHKGTGDDIIAHAESLANEILERAYFIAQGKAADEEDLPFVGDEPQPTAEGEGVQFCTPSEGSKLEGALSAIHRGIPVFPVHWLNDEGFCSCSEGARCRSAGKHPRIPEWQQLANTQERWINQWWKKWPDANIGVPTGEASGWLALDIDTRHGGDASLTALSEEFGDLPATLDAKTGGGGYHIIFAYPKGSNIRNSAGKLGEGIDVRGAGGFIVVAPSTHASGNVYQWLNDNEPAQAPEWLLKLLTGEKQTTTATPTAKAGSQANSGAAIGHFIPSGQRNDALFKIACSARGKGDDAEAAVFKAYEERCEKSPPMDEAELRKIARSAMRYIPEAEKRASVGA